MRRTALLLALILFASIAPAWAEWSIEIYRDRLNDRDLKFATFVAKAPDKGIVAKLEIVCRANGQLDHHVVLSTQISSGEIGGAYRIDEKATRTGSFKFYERGPSNIVSSWSREMVLFWFSISTSQGWIRRSTRCAAGILANCRRRSGMMRSVGCVCCERG
jgi:hypothetical protein